MSESGRRIASHPNPTPLPRGRDASRTLITGDPMGMVLIGLGANLGDPLSQLRSATRQIRGILPIDGVSAIYKTTPVGLLDQPDFLNLVLRARSSASTEDIFALLAAIEQGLGRQRVIKGGPRTIDIDLLGYGDVVLESDSLVVPHPRLHQRAFVLVPLADVAPQWRHPLLNATVTEMLEALGPVEGVVRWGDLWAESDAI